MHTFIKLTRQLKYLEEILVSSPKAILIDSSHMPPQINNHPCLAACSANITLTQTQTVHKIFPTCSSALILIEYRSLM